MNNVELQMNTHNNKMFSISELLRIEIDLMQVNVNVYMYNTLIYFGAFIYEIP